MGAVLRGAAPGADSRRSRCLAAIITGAHTQILTRVRKVHELSFEEQYSAALSLKSLKCSHRLPSCISSLSSAIRMRCMVALM